MLPSRSRVLPHSTLLILTIGAALLSQRTAHAQWYKKYNAAKPPSYLQPPWASAPGFTDAPLPVAPKPMAPPPPPPQGFQGAGRFYPPPPPPPPSPPPPLPPPPPAPAVNFPSYAPPSSNTPNQVQQDKGFAFRSTGPSQPTNAAVNAVVPPPTHQPNHHTVPKATPPTSLERFKGGAGHLSSTAAGISRTKTLSGRVSTRAASEPKLGYAKHTGRSSDHLMGSAYKDKVFAAAEALEKKMGLMSFLQLRSQMRSRLSSRIRGDGKGMMSFEYYDPNNPPPWLTPPWNVGPRTAPPMMGMPMKGGGMGMPYVSSNYGAIPPGAAPQMATPYSYNPGMAMGPIPPHL